LLRASIKGSRSRVGIQRWLMNKSKFLSCRRSVLAGAILVSALSLAGCSTAAGQFGGTGNPMDAQASMTFNNLNHYLAIHDMPPERSARLITPADQAKIRSELSAARARQTTGSKTDSR